MESHVNVFFRLAIDDSLDATQALKPLPEVPIPMNRPGCIDARFANRVLVHAGAYRLPMNHEQGRFAPGSLA